MKKKMRLGYLGRKTLLDSQLARDEVADMTIDDVKDQAYLRGMRELNELSCQRSTAPVILLPQMPAESHKSRFVLRQPN